MIRCGMLGFGWWGQTIARRLATSSIIRVTRVVDPMPAAREHAAGMGLAATHALEEVLSDRDIDAMIIATPNSQHEAQVVACAGAGKHVFCEKPLGLTLASARRSAEACAAAGVILGIGHERRFETPLEALRQLVATGGLGTILHIDAAFSHDKLAGLPKDNWRKDTVENPAGGMTASGIHLTDLLIWILGRVEYVSAMLVNALDDWHSGISCQLGFESGPTATISAILATPHDIHCRIYGSAAWAEVINEAHPDQPDGRAHLTIQRTGQAPEVTTYPWRDSVKANFEEFAAAIEGRQRYRFSLEEILHNVAVLEAASLSVRHRRTISISGDVLETTA